MSILPPLLTASALVAAASSRGGSAARRRGAPHGVRASHEREERLDPWGRPDFSTVETRPARDHARQTYSGLQPLTDPALGYSAAIEDRAWMLAARILQRHTGDKAKQAAATAVARSDPNSLRAQNTHQRAYWLIVFADNYDGRSELPSPLANDDQLKDQVEEIIYVENSTPSEARDKALSRSRQAQSLQARLEAKRFSSLLEDELAEAAAEGIF